MVRPVVGPPINLRLPPDLLAEIDRQASDAGQSRARRIRDLLTEAVNAQNDSLASVVLMLAKHPPVHRWYDSEESGLDGRHSCAVCSQIAPQGADRYDRSWHTSDCAWRRAFDVLPGVKVDVIAGVDLPIGCYRYERYPAPALYHCTTHQDRPAVGRTITHWDTGRNDRRFACGECWEHARPWPERREVSR